MLRECGELLCGWRFPLWLNWAVYKSYVRPVMLYWCEVWCLKESEIWILRRAERSMVSAMCGVQLKDRERSTDLKEAIDLLSLVNSVRWYGHVLKREDGHVFRKALVFEVEGQMKKGRPRRMWRKQVNEESMKVGLWRIDTLCVQSGVSAYARLLLFRLIWPPSLVGDSTRFYIWCLSLSCTLVKSIQAKFSFLFLLFFKIKWNST